MKKKLLALLLSMTLAGVMLAGCGDDDEKAEVAEQPAVEEETKEEPAEEPAAEAETEEEEVAEEETEAEAGFTFKDLQDNYAAMVEAYNAVVDLYQNDAIAQDNDVEDLLGQAKDVIEQMGDLTEDQFEGEADMLEMNDAILDILDGLDKTIDLMTEADTSADASEVTDEDLKAAYPVGYAGAGDDGSTILWALSEDTEQGILVIIAEDESDAISIVGDVINNGDGTITLTDEQSGGEVVLGIQEDTDDEGDPCIIITTEDSVGVLYEVPGEKVIDALLSYSEAA